jgi:hypothetical protein
VAVLIVPQDVGHLDPVAVDRLVVGDLDLKLHGLAERERLALSRLDEAHHGALADDDLDASDDERPAWSVTLTVARYRPSSVNVCVGFACRESTLPSASDSDSGCAAATLATDGAAVSRGSVRGARRLARRRLALSACS